MNIQGKAFVFSAAGMLAAVLCGAGKGAPEFDKPRTLAVTDSIGVGQIIAPMKFFAGEDRVAVQSWKGDTVFYVYGLPDFRLLYRFGRRGAGPGEFSGEVDPYATGTQGRIVLRGHGPQGRTADIYRIGDRTMEKVVSYPDPGQGYGYGMDFTVLSDTLAAGGYVSDRKKEKQVLRLVGLPSGQVKDSIVDFYEYGVDNVLNRNYAMLAASGNRLAIAYEEAEVLDIYRVEAGRFVHVTCVGGDRPPTRERIAAADNPKYAYENLFCDADYIYAVNARTDRQTLKEREVMYPVIEVFDWKGRPVTAFRLDREGMFPVFVDGKRKTAYACDPREDFDRIYIYKLPL